MGSERYMWFGERPITEQDLRATRELILKIVLLYFLAAGIWLAFAFLG